MKDLQKGDVLLCSECDLVLAQATGTIPLGAMNWTSMFRPVELQEMPAPGTLLNDITCPRCGARWYPTFLVARKE
jgi:hypothetical protein